MANIWNVGDVSPIPIGTTFQNAAISKELALDDLVIHVKESIMTKPELRSLPAVVSHILATGLIVSLSLGSFFKCVLYHGISRQKLTERPISVLILLGAVVHHATHVFYGINLALQLSLDVSLGDFLGEPYCQTEYFIIKFGMLYLSTGSFCLAVYRLLYIKYDNWVKYGIGERWLLGILGFGGLLITFLFGALSQIETHAKRVTYNSCMGTSQMASSFLIEYKESQGTDIQLSTIIH